MEFIYTYRTPDNMQHRASMRAASKDAAYAILKAQGIRPGRVEAAPGFLNMLFGSGKRWIAIVLLALVAAVSVLSSVRIKNEKQTVHEFDDTTRRQVIGDVAVIERGIRTGWSDVFAEEGERFLASFAIPGVPAGLRNTKVEEIEAALARRIGNNDSDGIEARQIKAMVEGLKDELREFLADGGTIVEYGRRLVQRQEEELGYYNRAKSEIENAKKNGMSMLRLEELCEKRNASLRRMGVKVVVLPEE